MEQMYFYELGFGSMSMGSSSMGMGSSSRGMDFSFRDGASGSN